MLGSRRVLGEPETALPHGPAKEAVRHLFTCEAASHSTGLSSGELRSFAQRGWAGPYPLLSSEGVAWACQSYKNAHIRFRRRNLLRTLYQSDAFSRTPWHKSMHAYLPSFCEIASHPAIVTRVASVLGPDVIAWGVGMSRVRPGQRHRWHVDVEHVRWPGVTIFLGLKNTSLASSLKVICGSHRIAQVPQAIGVDDDTGALTTCKRLDPDCELVTVKVKEGEFFLFDGRLWHSSHNTRWKWRSAIIAQYARPDAAIAIPLNYDQPIRWHSQQPPCVLVSGQDRSGVNRLVSPPVT
jgi:hypothetical protein